MSILVVRHGQTAWSLSGQHTGSTDVPLTAAGEDQARRLAPVFAGRRIGAVLVSPRQRARRTAELAGLADLAEDGPQVDEDLVEWDYGGYEGRTTEEISAELGRPWSVWHDGVVPGDTPGETVHQVANRARGVLRRAAALDGDRDVVLVAHGHFLRVLLATWLGLSPTAGALFALEAGTWGELGHEHERQALLRWSVPPIG
ncbi:histidine phosphatase family protein [Kineococcus aurantiacus]|uniref:Putative phosphoglycerate mutase n=1 Tax=Kineococcus aurantiacus TaxID=37633 RepID=A0A7Y9DNH9_9ACTN|nr:putative phosphoglycerate mutase [Kineococcus aurantiacus]